MLMTTARRQSKNPAIGEVYEVDPSSCMRDVIDVLHQVDFESIASMIRH